MWPVLHQTFTVKLATARKAAFLFSLPSPPLGKNSVFLFRGTNQLRQSRKKKTPVDCQMQAENATMRALNLHGASFAPTRSKSSFIDIVIFFLI